jgi:putative glycosyltransferase (TIGR04348 family)
MQLKPSKKPSLLIVSPALADANNGNWHTAARWARFLNESYRVAIDDEWHAGLDAPDGLIALHARRSASSVAAFAKCHPTRPLVLALTGTDVYRDIHSDASAQQSLTLAPAFITLQDEAAAELPAHLRSKVTVIYQSAPALKAVAPKRLPLTAVMVGHLREEKDPQTFMRAALALKPTPLKFVHIGAPLDAALGAAAVRTATQNPRYRWLGNLPRSTTRQHIKRAHVLVICSVMEGGANVIIEAITAGTPVLASRISGNVGMLGKDYGGYFDLGDDVALAALLQRCHDEPAFLRRLNLQCTARAPLFAPSTERASLVHLVNSLF